MRKIWIVLVVLILASCYQNKNLNPRSFNSIDYSLFAGGKVFCHKFNKDGIGSFYRCDGFRSRRFYFDMTLKSDQLDSISNMTYKIINSKLDTLYVCDSDAFSSECIVIKTIDKTYRYFIWGQCSLYVPLPEIKDLYDLMGYIDEIAVKYEEKLKDKFYFESYVTFLLPPPPPPPPDGSAPEETWYEKMRP
jgi:hypothetical protein